MSRKTGAALQLMLVRKMRPCPVRACLPEDRPQLHAGTDAARPTGSLEAELACGGCLSPLGHRGQLVEVTCSTADSYSTPLQLGAPRRDIASQSRTAAQRRQVTELGSMLLVAAAGAGAQQALPTDPKIRHASMILTSLAGLHPPQRGPVITCNWDQARQMCSCHSSHYPHACATAWTRTPP